MKPKNLTTSFLKKVEPIIRLKAKRYRPYIKGYDYEDLIQEGRVAALEAMEKWMKSAPGREGEPTRAANPVAWAWLRIEARFRTLGKRGYVGEESFDEIEEHTAGFAAEASTQAVADLFESHDELDENEARNAAISAAIKELLPKNYAKYIDAIGGDGLTPSAAAKVADVTPQRISQVTKIFENGIEDFYPKQRGRKKGYKVKKKYKNNEGVNAEAGMASGSMAN